MCSVVKVDEFNIACYCIKETSDCNTYQQTNAAALQESLLMLNCMY